MATLKEAEASVKYVVDDAGSGRRIGEDMHAKLRRPGEFQYGSVVVGWQDRNGSTVGVSVHSYLDVRLDDDEAIEMSRDYLSEIRELDESMDKPLFVVRL